MLNPAITQCRRSNFTKWSDGRLQAHWKNTPESVTKKFLLSRDVTSKRRSLVRGDLPMHWQGYIWIRFEKHPGRTSLFLFRLIRLKTVSILRSNLSPWRRGLFILEECAEIFNTDYGARSLRDFWVGLENRFGNTVLLLWVNGTSISVVTSEYFRKLGDKNFKSFSWILGCATSSYGDKNHHFYRKKSV